MLPAAWAATAALSLAVPTAVAPRALTAPGDFRRPVADLAFTPDGRGLVAVDGDGTVARWDLTSAARPRTTRLGPFPTHAAPQFAVGPGGRFVAVGSSAGPPRVFDAATGKLVATLPRPLPDADDWYPAFSGDGTRVVFGYDRGHGSPVPGPAAVPVWDVAADRAVGTVELPIPPGGLVVTRLALSADGSKLAAVITPAPGNRGDGTELGVWDVATGKRLGTRFLSDESLTFLAFLPGGPSVLVRHGGAFAVWSPAGDRWRRSPDRPDGTGPPVVSPDGRTFVAPVFVRTPGTIPVWYAEFETATLAERGRVQRATRADDYGWWAMAIRPDGGAVAVTHRTSILIHDPPAAAGPGGSPAEWWAALAGPAPDAGAAIRALVRRPDAAVALFREKLRPAADAAPDPAATAALIRRLDAPAFADREAAGTKLRAALRQVEPALRAAHASAAASPEQKERLAGLLAAADRLTPDELRHIRAVEALEAIGTPAAREVVRKLVNGSENAVLTREAKVTLARMMK